MEGQLAGRGGHDAVDQELPHRVQQLAGGGAAKRSGLSYRAAGRPGPYTRRLVGSLRVE